MCKVKKYIGLALMIGALASVHTWAASEEDFEYSFSGGGVTITEYQGGESQVEIPSTIEGTPVTAIGNSAFAWNTDISKVTVPASVTAVESYAFSGCVNLTSLYFMGDAPTCGAGVFNNCPDSLVIYYPEGSTGWGTKFGGRPTQSWSSGGGSDIELTLNGVVYTCVGTSAIVTGYTAALPAVVTLPSSIMVEGTDYAVTTLWHESFKTCSQLESITLPESVLEMGDYVFEGCTNLISVTLSETMTWIGYAAFMGCSSLPEIRIPEKVSSIGEVAFGECTGLTAIQVSASNPFYSSLDGVLFNRDQTTLICYPPAKVGVSYNIPDGVDTVGNWAFYMCDGLTKIEIPTGVNNIAECAFAWCTGLPAITLPSSIGWIGSYAFYACTSLEKIAIPDTIAIIESYTFAYCDSLKELTIPDSVSEVEEYAFTKCVSLTEIILPSSLDKIGKESFSDCTSVTRIEIPNSVTWIEVFAFYGCTSLPSITIPDNVSHIGNDVFGFCGSLTQILVDAANPYYSSLDGVLFNKNQTTLLCHPAGKSGPSYTIPNGVTEIGLSSFANSIKLTEIIIPASVTTIGDYAFWDCGGLLYPHFLGNAPTPGESIFGACSETLVVYYDEGTTGWSDTYGGCKTALWQPIPPVAPEIKYSTPVRQPDGSVTFVITYTGTLEWSSNTATWSEVEDATPASGEYTVNTRAAAARFYRVKS